VRVWSTAGVQKARWLNISSYRVNKIPNGGCFHHCFREGSKRGR